jgi:HK97 family phage major capsid protein
MSAAKLREIQEKRNKAITAARALLDNAETEKRSMTDEEKRQSDALLKEAGDLRADFDRITKLDEEERAQASSAISKKDDSEQQQKTPDAEMRSKAFRRLLTLDVSNGEQLTPEEYRSLSAGQDTAAGFLTTPQEFVQSLIAKVEDNVFVRALATVFPTTNANGLGFPTLDTDADDAEWSTEIKTFTEDTALKFGKRELKPHPVKKLIKASDKLLRADGINPEAIIMDRAAYKFGITEEKAYLLGTGDKQPLGLFTASAHGINTDRDVSTNMATTNFTADALKAVKYSLKAQYMKTAQWLFHRDGVAKIAMLKDGEGQYIFEMASALGAMDLLMGRPLNMSEYVPNTFTAGLYVGMFGDFSWYYIADSLALRVKRLNELYALTSEVGFIFDKETDGMPVLSEAFARIKTAAS